jgi:glycosyltransferase involved in cell wall biosynthesis
MALFPITSLGEVTYQNETTGVAEVVAVVPLYNYKDYITEALQSIVNQDLQALSVIVVDDCSIDEGGNIAVKFLRQHASRFTVARVVRHKRNQGLAMARNSGIAWTTEPFLFMLDADNRIRPPALSRLLQALHNSGATFAYSQLHMFGDEVGIGWADAWEPARLRQDNYIDAMALIRREALQKVGGYRVSAVEQGWEDWDLWCHCASLGLEGVFVPELLCEYRSHRASMLRGIEGGDLRSTQAQIKAELALRYPDLFNPAPDWISVNDIEMQCLKAPTFGAEVAVVASYSSDGALQPHVRHYIECLKREKIDVILIVSLDGRFAGLDADFPNSFDADFTKSLDGLFFRWAEGRDFAAWAQILRIHPELYASKIVYLINDSVIGPTNDAAFAALLRRIRASGADLISLTESFHQTWHLQSYFLAIKPNALSSSAFREFMGGVVAYQGAAEVVRDQVIKRYELRLAQRLKAAGLRCEALFRAYDGNTPTANHWKRLLLSGFPFVKIEVISGAVPDLDASDWRELIASQGYDPSIAMRTLEARRRGESP